MTALPHPITGELFDSPVPPGTGWPDDPAGPATPIAHSVAEVQQLAATAAGLAAIEAAVCVCRACPRLVDWRESVAAEKRKSFADQPYWGRPIAGWGSDEPKVLIVGLAPAANGGNRTGRIFTGDRSGDWLFAALHRVGLATQTTSLHAGDGQQLIDTRMVAAVRCAPPGNKPLPSERDACSAWLDAELALVLPSVRAVVCLGSYGWDAAFRALGRRGYVIPRPRPKFGHGAQVHLPPTSGGQWSAGPGNQESPANAGVVGRSAGGHAVGHGLVILGCFHPSQQNTFTGKLTQPMLDAVLNTAASLAH